MHLHTRTSGEDDGKPSIVHAACIPQQIIHVKSMPPLFFHTHTHTLARVRKKSLAISVVLLLDEHIQVVEEMMVNGDGGGW